ncbi:MAG: hypothetical protein QME68_03965, partial [Elusimicrobiota bacterium]|nr:hypothetical protein [Elusimicrobiota bacterium]
SKGNIEIPLLRNNFLIAESFGSYCITDFIIANKYYFFQGSMIKVVEYFSYFAPFEISFIK